MYRKEMNVAAPSGFEPEITDPESVVLPTTLRGKSEDIVVFIRSFGKGYFGKDYELGRLCHICAIFGIDLVHAKT